MRTMDEVKQNVSSKKPQPHTKLISTVLQGQDWEL